MRPLALALGLCALTFVALAAPADPPSPCQPGDCGQNGCMQGPGYLDAPRVCVRGIAGQVLDYSSNHGWDHRLVSPSLGVKRDFYVYLPPCYDPAKQYPAVLYLHGVMQDEKSLIEHLVRPLDEAIRSGRLPPMIVAAPDGSMSGNPSRFDPGSFFVNGPQGRFQDWVVNDVWQFVLSRFPVRPERRARILCGVSMGGFAAFNIGLKYADKFGTVIGVMPALNLRWIDCRGDCMGDFDPCCWGWRTNIDDPCEVIGDFGVIKVRMKDFIYPVFGRGEEALRLASNENPIELLDKTNLQPGVLKMFVGVGCQDEFNLDAQCLSFLWRLREKGLRGDAEAVVFKYGRHSERTAMLLLPKAVDWLNAVLAAEGIR